MFRGSQTDSGVSAKGFRSDNSDLRNSHPIRMEFDDVLIGAHKDHFHVRSSKDFAAVLTLDENG